MFCCIHYTEKMEKRFCCTNIAWFCLTSKQRRRWCPRSPAAGASRSGRLSWWTLEIKEGRSAKKTCERCSALPRFSPGSPLRTARSSKAPLSKPSEYSGGASPYCWWPAAPAKWAWAPLVQGPGGETTEMFPGPTWSPDINTQVRQEAFILNILKNGTEATRSIGHCANLIAAAWVRATVRRGAHSIISMAAAFIRVHSAESQCLLLSGSTGCNAEGRNVSVTGPVKVTAETQRGPFETASALSSVRRNWRLGRRQCGANKWVIMKWCSAQTPGALHEWHP